MRNVLLSARLPFLTFPKPLILLRTWIQANLPRMLLTHILQLAYCSSPSSFSSHSRHHCSLRFCMPKIGQGSSA